MNTPVKGVRISPEILLQFEKVKNRVKQRTGKGVTLSEYLRYSMVKEMDTYLADNRRNPPATYSE